MSAFKKLSKDLRRPFDKAHAFRKLRKFHASPHTLTEVVDNAIRFGTHGIYRVNSLQQRSEIMSLADEVAKLAPQIILEIGTANAGTLFIWSHCAKSKVITCDLLDMSPVEAFYQAFPPTGSGCRVVPTSGDSHTPEFRKRIENELGGKQVDFLFIDGDHTLDGVAKDYRDYSGLVRPGGIIAFHDILESQPFPTNQVFHFWKKLKPLVEHKEFVNGPNQCGFGIGMIRVPDAGAPAVD
jgi:predicted O-methyltransferase YrrM